MRYDKDSMTSKESINTTVGDLICAINDAAAESVADTAEAARLTQMILLELLNRGRR
jgi:hypothetical protein